MNEEIDRKVEKWKNCDSFDSDIDSGIESDEKWMNEFYCYRYNRISFDTIIIFHN
jgi:hypothetical protein